MNKHTTYKSSIQPERVCPSCTAVRDLVILDLLARALHLHAGILNDMCDACYGFRIPWKTWTRVADKGSDPVRNMILINLIRYN